MLRIPERRIQVRLIEYKINVMTRTFMIGMGVAFFKFLAYMYRYQRKYYHF